MNIYIPVLKMEKYPAVQIETVRLFMVIAAFILLIACINFMNLSTARSEKRAKEVGIRKVSGAYKSAWSLQFLGESLLIAIFQGSWHSSWLWPSCLHLT